MSARFRGEGRTPGEGTGHVRGSAGETRPRPAESGKIPQGRDSNCPRLPKVSFPKRFRGPAQLRLSTVLLFLETLGWYVWPNINLVIRFYRAEQLGKGERPGFFRLVDRTTKGGLRGQTACARTRIHSGGSAAVSETGGTQRGEEGDASPGILREAQRSASPRPPSRRTSCTHGPSGVPVGTRPPVAALGASGGISPLPPGCFERQTAGR